MTLFEEIFGMTIKMSDEAMKKEKEKLTSKHIQETFKEDKKNAECR